MSKDENIAHYEAGDLVFQKGDAGGDLLFIQKGAVEIFTHQDHQEVVLTEMKDGEIIGVMTCLTADPRMASARAKTALVLKKVPHSSIKKVLSSLPNWMGIVLKEFAIRLNEMNEHYSESVLANKSLQNNQISSLFIAAQIASAFAATAPSLAKKIDEKEAVFVEEMMDHLEVVLNIERSKLDRIFRLMLDSGLLKVELESVKKRTIAQLPATQRLAWFAQFVNDSKRGKGRKLIRAGFRNKDMRVLMALVQMTSRLGMDASKACQLNCEEMVRSLEKATGTRMDLEVVAKAATLGLCQLEGTFPAQLVRFVPAELGRTVAAVEAIRKLQATDQARVESKAA